MGMDDFARSPARRGQRATSTRGHAGETGFPPRLGEPPSPPATVYRNTPRVGRLDAVLVFGGVAALAFPLAVVLFATGYWAAGSALAGAGAVAAALFVVSAARQPASGLGAAVLRSRASLRARAGVARTGLREWAAAGRETVRLRREQWRLRLALRQQLFRLGEAAFAEDEARMAELKSEARRLCDELEHCDRLMAAALAGARGRVERERRAARRTAVVPPAEDR